MSALSQVRRGWTRAQVKKLLGPPDDVWPMDDSSDYVEYGRDRWCYGTNGHHTMPTLGSITFDKGTVWEIAGAEGSPPSPSVISETELVASLRTMYVTHGTRRRYVDDPLHLIRVANMLIGKGHPKAVAILGEYSRLLDSSEEDQWLFWEVRFAFNSKLPGGAFPIPGIGQMFPTPPNDHSKWPLYPIVAYDDIPYNFLIFVTLAGFPEPFAWYLRDHAKEWTLRTEKRRPPDDPFASYMKFVSSPAWPLPPDDPKAPYRSQLYRMSEGGALAQILTLVRTAYAFEGPWKTGQDVNGPDITQCHRGYLELGCKWSESRQMYVRGDGSTLTTTTPEYRQHKFVFRGIPSLDVSIVYSREDEQSVKFDAECREKGAKPIRIAILSAEDALTKANLVWSAINAPEPAIAWSTPKAKLLALPAHAPDRCDRSLGSTFRLTGRSFRFTVELEGRRHTSPILAP